MWEKFEKEIHLVARSKRLIFIRRTFSSERMPLCVFDDGEREHSLFLRVTSVGTLSYSALDRLIHSRAADVSSSSILVIIVTVIEREEELELVVLHVLSFFFWFPMLLLSILLLLFSSPLIFAGDEFEDYRCKCVCPSLNVLDDRTVNDTNRRVYVDVVSPDDCNCQRVVFHSVIASKDFQDRFCPR